MLGYYTGCAVEHALQVIEFSLVLDFYNDYLAFVVFYLEIDAIEFVGLVLFIAFAFQDFKDENVFAQKFA